MFCQQLLIKKQMMSIKKMYFMSLYGINLQDYLKNKLIILQTLLHAQPLQSLDVLLYREGV